MKNKLLCMTSLILMVFILCSCTRGSFSVLMGDEKNTPHKMSMAYERFNGYKEFDLTVDKGQKLTLTVEIVTEKGELDMKVTKNNDDEDKVIYEQKSISTSNFNVELSEEGSYTIRFDGKDHYGSYYVVW